jgi:hypothetical protein
VVLKKCLKNFSRDGQRPAPRLALVRAAGNLRLQNKAGIRQYSEHQPSAMVMHDAPREYLVGDALAEVQTIKEAVAALERKLKKLKP